MTKNNSYPLQLVKAFRAGEITRQQFINKFTLWQKSCGINFDCKGTADRNGVYMTYRGTKQQSETAFYAGKITQQKQFLSFSEKWTFQKTIAQSLQ